MKLLSRLKKEKGWLVIDESPDGLKFVHGFSVPGARASIDSWSRVVGGALERAAKEGHFDRYRCAALLRPGEYQIVLVDAPAVPLAELKSAVRWSIKDRLDYPVEEATFDVLDIPSPERAARAHSVFAVAAKNEVVERYMKRFEAARTPLEVIDIPETAQRNIAALYAVEKRGTALLYVEQESSLLTINCLDELYLARRLDVGAKQILKVPPTSRGEIFERIQIELQRTFDHFDRQFAITVAKLVIGPEPEDTGLEAFLRANFDLAVEHANLAERMAVVQAARFDAPSQWRMFHLVGAALRAEDATG